MGFCFEDLFFVAQAKAGAQNIESQVEGVGSHVVGSPWAWAETLRVGFERRGVLGCCSPKHILSSHDQILLHCHCIPGQLDHLISPRTREGLDRATKSSTEGNDGGLEEVATDSFDEEGSMRQLELTITIVPTQI